MNVIQLKKRFYFIPSNWDELTGRQLIAVCAVLHRAPEETAGKLMLLRILTGMSWWRWLFQNPVELEDHLPCVDFLLSNYPVKQLLPKYGNLYGPAGEFDNMRAGEFAFCEFFFKEYENKGAENGINDLNQLVGALYRSHKANYDGVKNEDGDVREPFNKNLTDVWYPAQVARWPLAVKLAIAAWYKGCRLQLQQQFKIVFNGGGGEPAKYGLWSVINGVAEKGTHGTFQQVEQMLLKEFLMELSEGIEKAKKMEQQLNKK